MFPGTHFSPPHFYYEIKATTVPESSGGDSNYGAKTPVISGIAKFHWRRDYATGSTWTRTSFPGWESPDSYASEGYDNWADNTLRQKFIGDSVSAVTSPGVYVINIPSDVAMGTKEHTYNVFNGYWIPEPAVLTGEFPYGSTVIIHNHGIIAGSGGLAGEAPQRRESSTHHLCTHAPESLSRTKASVATEIPALAALGAASSPFL